MAEDLKRVGLVFKADGAVEFQKSLQDVNSAIKENYSQYKLAQSEWDKSTSSVKKLADRQKYLADQTEAYQQKIARLNEILEEQESAENKDEKAISKTRQEIANAQAKLNDYEKSLKEVTQQLLSGAAAAKEFGDNMKDTGGKITEAGKEMSKVSAGIAAVGVASVKASADFESSMDQVQATLGITSDAVSELNGESVNTMDALNNLAEEFGTGAYNATECGEAINYLALAGYNTQETYNTLPSVLNLASAGTMELADASDMLTDEMSALGLDTTYASTMVDQMAKTASKTNTSVSQLGEGMLTVGATAKNLSGGTVELSTMLGVLADNGIKASEGGTHFRNILLSLQDAAVDGSVDFGDFSVAIYDADGNMRSTIDIIKDMQAGMEGMTQESKDAMISGVFNKTDLASVNALLGTSSERFDELTDAITNSDGAAEEMADTQLSNLNGQLTILKNTATEGAISIGERLTPYISKMVEWVQSAVEWFNSLSDQQLDLIITIAGIVAAIGPLLVIIGTVISTIGTIASAIGTVMSLWATFSGALAAGGTIISALVAAFGAINVAVVAVIAAIAAVIAIGVLLYKNWDKIIAFAKNLWTTLKTIFTNLLNTIKTIFTNIQTAISNAVRNALTIAVSTFNNIKTAISNAVASAYSAVTSKFNSIKSTISSVLSSAYSVVSGFVSKLKSAFNFSWSLPKLKIPTITVTGGVAPYGIGGLGSLPKFHIKWNKEGLIMRKATIFGSTENQLLGGGEAGDEALLPIEKLKSFQLEVNRSTNTELLEAMQAMFGTVIYEAFLKALMKVKLDVNLNDEVIAELFAEYIKKVVLA